jgi:plasmid maintenance system killer protein
VVGARVTRNYGITFGWLGESALDIDYEDYH